MLKRKDESMEAIALGSLFVQVGEQVACVIDLEILEEAGEHGTVSLLAVSDKETKDVMLHDTNGVMTLFYIKDREENELEVLFQGFILKTKVEAEGETYYIRIEAITSSYLMDTQSYNISYQDVSFTSHQLIQKVVDFVEGQVQIRIPNVTRDCIAVQYQETLWEFLKRIASEYEAYVYPDSSTLKIQLRVGLSEIVEWVEWDDLPYRIERNTAPKSNSSSWKKQIRYYVQAYDILSLGNRVYFHGEELWIGKVNRYISNGLLVSDYVLYFEEGLRNKTYSNPLISGVSIYAFVQNIKRNKVQVQMITDLSKECKSPYYFPFSTVAASSDGSGWYCMPKVGDMVRIFFPTSKEREAYAIACTMGEATPTQESPMANPDLKDITAPDGKTVKFIEGGILLSSGGAGAVKLTNDGAIEITSKEDIFMNAAQEITISTEGELELSAGEEIQIGNDSGSSISLKGDTIEASATLIYNNC